MLVFQFEITDKERHCISASSVQCLDYCLPSCCCLFTYLLVLVQWWAMLLMPIFLSELVQAVLELVNRG